MPLILTVPTPDPVEDLTVETRTKPLKEWLDNLPLANPAEVARNLSEEIGALNRQKVAMDTRLKLLELYRSTILKLLPDMEAQYVAARLPLPEKNREMALLARQLQMDLANGYKIILLDYQNARITLGKGKVVLLAAQRAMAALGQILAIFYQTYSPQPSGIWYEIHQIFRFAIEQDIANKSIDDPDGESSVSLIYKQTLLLALANPYHLNPGEVGSILGYLRIFGNLALLQPFAPSGNPVGLFLVATQGDNPPKLMPDNPGEVDNRSDILLNTLELAHALKHHLSQLEAGEAPKNLHLPDIAKQPAYQDLLRRLLKQWSVAPKRMFHRSENISSTEVCIGIPALHHFLGGPASADQTDLSFVKPTKDPRFIAGKWLIVNESAGGLALRGAFEVLPQIRPGDVIGLKSDGESQWNIAVVRWVKSDKADHLEIGAQLLAPKAEPVMVKPSIAGPADAFQPALLLPEILLLKQPETLIASRGCFGSQRELIIESSGGTSQIMVRADKMIEQTAGFERFQFKRG